MRDENSWPDVQWINLVLRSLCYASPRTGSYIIYARSNMGAPAINQQQPCEPSTLRIPLEVGL